MLDKLESSLYSKSIAQKTFSKNRKRSQKKICILCGNLILEYFLQKVNGSTEYFLRNKERRARNCIFMTKLKRFAKKKVCQLPTLRKKQNLGMV